MEFSSQRFPGSGLEKTSFLLTQIGKEKVATNSEYTRIGDEMYILSIEIIKKEIIFFFFFFRKNIQFNETWAI